jgi:hypothetical protein
MLIRDGAWYATQRGRVVGPVQRMSHTVTEAFWFEDYFETGIWDRFGWCHPETRTGYSYGNLVCETEQPKQEETML